MSDEKPISLRSTSQMCTKIAEVAIDLLTDRLLAEAGGRDQGWLERREIADLASDFKRNQKKKYLRRTRQIAADWLHEIEREVWDMARKHPFERALVKRFSQHFPPAESLANKTAVSRRALRGIFLALDNMAGPEFMQQCHGAGRRIFKQIKEDKGKDFRWMDFYDDRETNDLIDDLMVVVARCFKDFNARLGWLRDLVNANLSGPEDYLFEGAGVAGWRLSKEGLLEVLSALYSDFAEKLADEHGRRAIERRYGQKAMATLDDLKARLFESDEGWAGAAPAAGEDAKADG